MPAARKVGGFTLIEMLIVVALFTTVTFFLAPMFKEMVSSLGSAEKKRQEKANGALANALLKYARTKDTLGKLPSPFTGGNYFSVPVNTANTNLVALTNEFGITRRELNDDGKATKRVRVYQIDPDQTVTMPLYFQSGPLITLTYDIGVIYQTDCALSAACNKAPYAGLSAVFNNATASTWKPNSPDYGAAQLSTLPLQQSMLDSTGRVLDRLRDALLTYYKDMSIAAAANDVSNFFPMVTTPPSVGPLGGQSPATNQGCRDGWYALDDPAVSILDELALNRGQFGVTAWGGSIEFCRKYDPAETGSELASPHYGALRINQDVSKGLAPSSTVANNIILTF